MVIWNRISLGSYPRVLFLLCLFAAIGACSKDNPAAPPTNATVAVDVTPDSTIFAWDLTGPENFNLSGSGDTVLAEMPPGEYSVRWRGVKYYVTPWPVTKIKQADAGGTITFEGDYERRPGDSVEILFLGSSYFAGNLMVGTIRQMALSNGMNVLKNAHNPSGMFLEYHASNSTSQSLIASRDWDCVVLQGVGSIVAYPERAHFDLIATLRSLERSIHGNCAATRIIFCMPWAFEDGMLWTPGGTDDYFDMQEIIYDKTITYPDSVDIEIAPVGWAWHSILSEDPGEHYLHMHDWNHPSFKGTYLMACVILSSVFREPVTDTPYSLGVTDEEAAHFQETATRIVMEDLELWHLAEPGR
jgi:hypothetical protein